jgi:hypothetical protein
MQKNLEGNVHGLIDIFSWHLPKETEKEDTKTSVESSTNADTGLGQTARLFCIKRIFLVYLRLYFKG